MKVKRIKEMSELERSIMKMVWEDVQKLPSYMGWRGYKRKFVYDHKPYQYECEFLVEDNHLQLRNVHIEHEQVVIELAH
jgi:hypothetical protein